MALKITRIDGPNAVFTRATYTFASDALGTEIEKLSIKWRTVLSNERVILHKVQGPSLTLTIPKEYAGHSFKVIADGGATPVTSLPIVVVQISKPYPSVVASLSVSVKSVAYKNKRKRNRIRWDGVANKASYVVGYDAALDYGGTPPDVYKGMGAALSDVGPLYSAESYQARFGHWARILEPTLTAEGKGCFAATNTYDKGRLSFGLVQFSSMIANANFVLVFKEMLERPEAKYFFHELEIKDVAGKKRICKVGGQSLEDDNSTADLCDYLNRDPRAAGDEEATNLARLIYWTRAYPDVCDIQARYAVAAFKGYLSQLKGDKIQGKTDSICAVICDIRNQGRGGSSAMTKIRDALALNTNARVYRALLAIRSDAEWQAKRVRALDGVIRRLESKGVFGVRKYDEKAGNFV